MELERTLLENPWVPQDRCASAGEGGGGVGETVNRELETTSAFLPTHQGMHHPLFRGLIDRSFQFRQENDGGFG